MGTVAVVQSDAKKKKMFKWIAIVFLIVIALLVTTLIVVKHIKKKRAEKKLKEGDSKKVTDGKGSGGSPGNDQSAFPLQKGSKGKYVLQLQEMLNVLKSPGQTKVAEDGDFGEQTYQAVVTYVGSGYVPVTKEKYMEIIKRVTEKMKTQSPYKWNPSGSSQNGSYTTTPS